MAEQVVAEVVLKARDGTSVLEAEQPITLETAKRYKVDEERVRQVREQLAASGFEVVAVGPHSLSITGDKGLFERVFQTRLRQATVSETGVPAPARTFYEAEDLITIPEDLAPFVAAVTLPKPPERFP